MTTGADLVAAARRYKGITESPRGSNCNQFSKRLGRGCEKWCGDFYTCAHLDVGVDLTKVLTPSTASCPAILAAAKAKGWLIPKAAALPGDGLLYQFDNDAAPDHVEIATSTAGGKLTAIGGNTGHGNQANGGEVYEQARAWSLVMAVVRIPAINGPHPAPPVSTNPLVDLRRQAAHDLQDDCLALPVPMDNRTPPGPDVTTLQKCINIAMPYSNIPLTGAYDGPTAFCVLAFQKIMTALNGGTNATPDAYPGQFSTDTRWLMAVTLGRVAAGQA